MHETPTDKSGIKITTIHRWSRHIPVCDTPVEDDLRQTFYLQGEWRRLEAPRCTLDPERRFGGPLTAKVVRPDLGQIFELNLDAKEYFSWPWPPDLTNEAFRALILKMPARLGNFPTDPTYRTETTDTGERKEMFGYLAKHLITTTKWGLHEGVQDGWYIDLEPQFYPILYQPQWIAGELRYSGTGFPVQEVQTSKSPNLGRSWRKMENRSEMEVTIEKGTYDQALFEVPPDFKLLDYNPVKFGRE